MPAPTLTPLTDKLDWYGKRIGCEMANSEDACQGVPVFWLDAPSIWVKPMLCCQVHADELTSYGLISSAS